jgi:hypothetical protein
MTRAPIETWDAHKAFVIAWRACSRCSNRCVSPVRSNGQSELLVRGTASVQQPEPLLPTVQAFAPLRGPPMPSADSSPGGNPAAAECSQCPWHATSRGAWEVCRGKRSYRQGTDAGGIQHPPRGEGGRCGCVPARPDGPTPPLRFVCLVPHRRSTLPSDAPSRGRPGALGATASAQGAQRPFPWPAAPRIPGQGTFTPEHDRMHGTHVRVSGGGTPSARLGC